VNWDRIEGKWKQLTGSARGRCARSAKAMAPPTFRNRVGSSIRRDLT